MYQGCVSPHIGEVRCARERWLRQQRVCVSDVVHVMHGVRGGATAMIMVTMLMNQEHARKVYGDSVPMLINTADA